MQKIFHDPDNQDGVIIHLDPDILDWEVKWEILTYKYYYEQS